MRAKHFLATGALEPAAVGSGGGSPDRRRIGHILVGVSVGVGEVGRRLADGASGGVGSGGAVGEHEQARGHLVILLRGGVFAGAAEGGRRVYSPPLALGVAAHVAEEGLP